MRQLGTRSAAITRPIVSSVNIRYDNAGLDQKVQSQATVSITQEKSGFDFSPTQGRLNESSPKLLCDDYRKLLSLRGKD